MWLCWHVRSGEFCFGQYCFICYVSRYKLENLRHQRYATVLYLGSIHVFFHTTYAMKCSCNFNGQIDFTLRMVLKKHNFNILWFNKQDTRTMYRNTDAYFSAGAMTGSTTSVCSKKKTKYPSLKTAYLVADYTMWQTVFQILLVYTALSGIQGIGSARNG